MAREFSGEISEEQVKGLNNFLEQMIPEELEKIAGGFSAAGAAAALSGGAKIMADKLLGGLSERSKQILKRLGIGAAAVVSLYLLYRTLPRNGSPSVERVLLSKTCRLLHQRQLTDFLKITVDLPMNK